MKLAELNPQNVRYFVRMMLLIVSVCLLDCAVALFVKKPFPWVAMIPGLVPILIVPLVIMPILREQQKS
jgi:hypothetical protein